MNEKYLRRRHFSNPNGFTTSSPLFYSIPWSPMEYSMTGLGPGQSCTYPQEMHPPELQHYPSMYHLNHSHNHRDSRYEYRNQYNNQRMKETYPMEKPWWNGRELTSKFDQSHPSYPSYTTSNSTSEGLSTYTKDYRGLYGDPAPLCSPEGEIERAEKSLKKKEKKKFYSKY